jgi:VWFA-related protein
MWWKFVRAAKGCNGEEDAAVIHGFKIAALSAVLGASLIPAGVAVPAAAQQTPQPSQVPDAPTPQAPVPLTDAAGGPIKPGGGAGTETKSTTSGSGDLPLNQPQAPVTPPAQQQQAKPPVIPASGQAPVEMNYTIRLYSNFVQVPTTVKDSKGKLVAGLTWRDFKVFENGKYVPLAFYTVDPFPMSMVFVVDQSLRKDEMAQVNDSLGAIQGALTPADELEVITYGNGAHNLSGAFTGAQTARVPFLLSMTKAAGTEQLNPVNDGPFGGCSVTKNGGCVDPNVQVGRSVGNPDFITIPKEIHTLNDAILAAAKELSTRPKERRRIIYVISDGAEYGSKAKYPDVLKYLETNNISVYGTLVGDAARWGEGFISRIHIPFTGVYDNILVKYTFATGGTLDSEHGVNNIEKSYQALAEEARNQYMLGYYSHESPYDSKFRKIDVRVDRPNLEVAAKSGYWPTAVEQK